MRTRVAALILAFLAAACSRSLEVPSKNRLAVSADATTLAPRDRTTVRATGGAGPYHFAFAAGSPLSGRTASLAAGTGAGDAPYQAGESGSAVDEVEVRDAAGAVATVRLAVTARLAATPATSLVAPGGAVPLVVTGGKPDYVFSLSADPSSDATITASGVYVAGTAGDLVDRVVVTDGTHDPDAIVTAEIHVGPALDVYPRAIAVAPNESVSFVAFGGAGSYGFTLGSAGSVGAEVGAATGVYVAGDNPQLGPAYDLVVVTDANGRSATATVRVGAALRVVLANTRFRPGVPVSLTASGGKPPYLYGFAAKGNRTAGTVDAASGEYTPGWNLGASDVLQATDATGTVATLAFEPRPDAVRLAPGESAYACVPHQLDAAGAEGVVIPRATMSFSGAEDVSFGPDAIPVDGHYPLFPYFTWAEASDTDLDTAYELLLGSSSGLREMDRGLDGSLAAGALVTDYTGRPAALARPYSGAPAFYQRELYVAESCGTAGIRRFTWVSHTITAGCEELGATPLSGVAPAGILALAAGDLDGNGYDDLAWFASTSGPLTVGLRGSGGFTSLLTLPYPDGGAGTTFSPSGDLAFRAVPLPGTSARGIAVLLDAGEGSAKRKQVWIAFHQAGALHWTAWSPYDPGGEAPVGIAGFVPAGSGAAAYLTWTGKDGILSGFTWDPAAPATVVPLATLPAEAPFPVTCATPFRAYPGGPMDLYVGSRYSSAAEVSYGDGDGTFGRTSRFLLATPFALGDVDGDGLDDVVTATGTPGLRILYGGSEQLAQGPETAIPTKPNVLAAGDFAGLPRATVIYQDELGTAWHAVTLTDGTPLPPVLLTLENPDGSTPTRLVSNWVAAELGGEAAGVDLFQDDGSSFGATFDAWIRYGARSIVRVAIPAPPAGTGACRAQPLPAANGGAPAAVTVCEYTGNVVGVFYSVLSGAGRARSFGAWTPLVPAGGDLARIGNVYPQSAGLHGGHAWFAVKVPEPWLLEVVNGTPPTATWRRLPQTFARALVADLDGAGEPDVVISQGQTVTRLLAQGTATVTYRPGGALAAPGSLAAVPRLGATGATPTMLSSGAALDPVRFAIPLPASTFR